MGSRRTGYDGYDPDAEAETVRPAAAAAMRRLCEAEDAAWMTAGDEPVLRYKAAAGGDVIAEGEVG